MRQKLTVLFIIVTVATLSAALIWAQGTATGPVKVQVPAPVMAKATMPAPPANAKQATSVGKGKVKANTANSAGDTDSFWIEQIDIDGDGNVDQTDEVWDDEDKILYLYSDGTFTCKNGGTGDGSMMIGIYGQGNMKKKPAGSGWYVVELDKTECAVQAAAVYGCKFDAKGNATSCGLATIDDKNDDIMIVTVQ